MANKHLGKCPFCNETSIPVVIVENVVRRDECRCSACGGTVLVCRTPGCSDYAKGGQYYDDELCPACTSAVANTAGDTGKIFLTTAATAIAAIVLSKK